MVGSCLCINIDNIKYQLRKLSYVNFSTLFQITKLYLYCLVFFCIYKLFLSEGKWSFHVINRMHSPI